MKIHIEAESQAELDAKRPELLKALAGDRFECVVKARGKGVYADEKPALTPRGSPISAENGIVDYWNERWDAMVTAMKDEINVILQSKF